MNRNKWVVLALLAFISAGGWWFFQKKSASVKKQKSSVEFVSATKGPIEQVIEATGEVVPLNRIEIKPPVSGRVESILVNEGDRIKTGQTLAWMSSSDRAAILDAARAQSAEELRRWEDAYKPTPILAPLSGTVILKNVVVGQTIDPATILFAISDKLIVLAQVDEADIGSVRLNMPVRYTLDAYPMHELRGTVFQILHEGKNVSNVITYGVKVEPDSVPAFFRSQMTANLNFIVQRKEDVVLIPTPAVTLLNDGSKQVQLVGPDKKNSAVAVITGIESSNMVEIVSGLSEGDKVMLSQARYAPQRGPKASPLTMGGRPPSGNSSSRTR